MAAAKPVHGTGKPLSKDAQKIKQELKELETNAGDNVTVPEVPPGERKLDDGTLRTDN